MTEYTIDMIKGTTVMEQMRSLIKVVIEFINGEGGDVEEVRQMVLTEIADRTAQDGQLQLQIQAEATARISQDNELRTAIQTETAQRETQVQTLTANLEQEAQTRQASDDALETAIQTAVQGEADARQAQYNTLLQGLQNEAGARQSQDAQLSSDIQNEASQRASADSGLSHDISDLTTRVGTVETSVSEIIQGTQVVGAAQNQGYADNQGEAQVGDHVVSTTANIGDDNHPVKIVNGVPVQISGNIQAKMSRIQDTSTSPTTFTDFMSKVNSMGVGSIIKIDEIIYSRATNIECTILDFIGIITRIQPAIATTIFCLSGYYKERNSSTTTTTFYQIVNKLILYDNQNIGAFVSNTAGGNAGLASGPFNSVSGISDLQT